MKPLLLKALLAAVLSAASLSASAVGRLADVQVLDRSTGQNLPVHVHRGEYWIAGQPGAKYAIQIRNSKGTRVLAVTSVDGLNVLSGETADYGQSGYVFERGQAYGIEGWRKSDQEVAAFVFTASGDSYAQRIGKPRDMGVIGVALFRERPPVALHSPPVIAHNEASTEPRTFPRSRELPDHNLERSAGAAPPHAPSPAPASAAPSAQADASERKAAPVMQASPKLGTAHGERETSIVSRTQFVRNSPQPDEIIRIRYDSHANLVAMGIIPSPQMHPTPNAFPGATASYVPDPPPAWR
jgi:hypothetical protein